MLFTVVTASSYSPTTYADQITLRSLTLVNNGSNGGSQPGVAVHNKFTFTVPSVGDANLGSIKFEYCTTASLTSCTKPTGLDASSATFGNETGSSVTGFSMGDGGTAPVPTQGVVVLTRTSASVSAGSQVIVQVNNVVNPTTANETFYVRITTYSGEDGATGAVDAGTVTASTANQIDFSGVMPETLVFCTGTTVTVDCQTVTTGVIYFTDLFSPSATVFTTSEMAASTNAGQGYVITVSGATLESGGNSIPAIGGTGTAVSVGTSEFGMNLMNNATPNVGADISPALGGDYTGSPANNYDTADEFAFDDTQPVTVASSTGPSAAQKYTASYIVNVAGNQPPGTYTTTLTYICTPTY